MAWVVKAWRAERLVEELTSSADMLELERVARELSQQVAERRIRELSVPTTQPATAEQLARTRAARRAAKPVPAPLPIPARRPVSVQWPLGSGAAPQDGVADAPGPPAGAPVPEVPEAAAARESVEARAPAEQHESPDAREAAAAPPEPVQVPESSREPRVSRRRPEGRRDRARSSLRESPLSELFKPAR